LTDACDWKAKCVSSKYSPAVKLGNVELTMLICRKHKPGAVARTLLRQLGLVTNGAADDILAPCGCSSTSCQYLHSSKSRQTAAFVC
jgi:hypothetical protein